MCVEVVGGCLRGVRGENTIKREHRVRGTDLVMGEEKGQF